MLRIGAVVLVLLVGGTWQVVARFYELAPGGLVLDGPRPADRRTGSSEMDMSYALGPDLRYPVRFSMRNPSALPVTVEGIDDGSDVITIEDARIETAGGDLRPFPAAIGPGAEFVVVFTLRIRTPDDEPCRKRLLGGMELRFSVLGVSRLQQSSHDVSFLTPGPECDDLIL
ncbi:hypothetical protein [Catellatospora sp. NPDC049133]|uniref:hypothetical protein n=1 Tax=Catellatospora sp. NPDC049133 TaxID=3155499 RepID=UPI0033F0DB83